jgi:kanamycin kinase/aminoglycoside 3'-phosphotransferase-2
VLPHVQAAAGRSWTPVTVGQSGARVWRSEGCYLKAVEARTPAAVELAGEAERSRWLRTQGLAAPEVLDTGDDGRWQWMLTAAVRGRSLAEPWPGHLRRDLVGAVSDALVQLHSLDPAACPFRRDIAATVPAAAAAASAGEVDLDDLDAERTGREAVSLLAELIATQPPSEDLVVCHGDLCTPNVLVDPDDITVTGLVDLGRLGVADRHQDLALLARSLGGDLNPQYAAGDVDLLLGTYARRTGVLADSHRLAWYRLLDEFF